LAGVRRVLELLQETAHLHAELAKMRQQRSRR
jgi:hypothetical protein